MKKTITALGILLLLFFTYHNINYISHDDSKTCNVETYHKVNLVDIKNIGKIELSKYEFNDIVTYKIKRNYLPDASAVLSVNLNAIVSIDLNNINDNDIELKNDTLYIKLPKPEISTLYIDHSKSHIIDTDYAFMDSNELIDSTYTNSEKNISNIVKKYNILNSISVDSPGYKNIQKFIERVSLKPVKLYF